MSQYEMIIACVACTNLVLTLLSLWASRQKAGVARIEALEREMRDALHEHGATLATLTGEHRGGVTHDHLAEVYRTLNDIAAQVNQLLGSQQQTNDTLRLLLTKNIKG